MKLTTRILLFIFIVMIAGLLLSNMVLKKQYNALDKSDVYWTYNKLLEQPFKYLNIKGGNETNIYYEQSDKPSVRLLQEWVTYHHGEINAFVKSDTLFLNFDYVPATPFDKYWLENAAPVRIFAPQLLYVNGNNTNLEMHRLKQKYIAIRLMGKSRIEAESLFPKMDSISVFQTDSSVVKFEMSPDYRIKPTQNEQRGKIEFHSEAGTSVPISSQQQNNFDESMFINSVTADITGHSILDIGHAQIRDLHLKVSDSSAIILSGNAIKKVNAQK
ncbi:MAG TPA: hypothetical protein VFQ58_00285 [Flavisolibacter sp.]|nr:hypothetical protein [Flavisolibacter sp.]